MTEPLDDAIDWIELLRVHDRFEAEITVGMLEDHDVPVRTLGGATTALPTIGLTDVRILVPRAEVERAGQVLAAMRGGVTDVHPFRDAPQEPYDPPVRRHKTRQFVWAMVALTVAYATMALLHR
jgi:Putative prokaryotic signal transducing protein